MEKSGYEVAIYDLTDSSGYQSEQEQKQAVLDAVFSNETIFVYVMQAHGFGVVDENRRLDSLSDCGTDSRYAGHACKASGKTFV